MFINPAILNKLWLNFVLGELSSKFTSSVQSNLLIIPRLICTLIRKSVKSTATGWQKYLRFSRVAI